MPLVAFKPTKARLVIEQGRESVLVMRVVVAKGETVALAVGGRPRIDVRVPAHSASARTSAGRNENKIVGLARVRSGGRRRRRAQPGELPDQHHDVRSEVRGAAQGRDLGRLPSKFFVNAGDKVSARETRGMGYAIRAGVRTKFWDNKRYRSLQVTNFSVILPISVPDAPGSRGFRGGPRDGGVADEQRSGIGARRRIRGVPGRDQECADGGRVGGRRHRRSLLFINLVLIIK
jgi:hypothetical protein